MMKISTFLILISLLSISAFAQKTIYGDDNRHEVYQEKNLKILAMADATAALFYNGRLSLQEDGNYAIQSSFENRGRAMNLCSTERFREQPITAYCTGFLVAPDLVVTAGHCIYDETDCDWSSVVFHFALTEKNTSTDVAKKEDVYRCKEVIKKSFSPFFGNKADYSLIRLDRSVTHIKPLKLNPERLNSSAKLLVIGHPDGMPMKIAGDATVRKNPKHSHSFVTNTDSFGGNSGSPVFNLDTGMVEGILVRGPKDYVEKDGCKVAKVCAMDGCAGELVTRIQELKFF